MFRSLRAATFGATEAENAANLAARPRHRAILRLGREPGNSGRGGAASYGDWQVIYKCRRRSCAVSACGSVTAFRRDRPVPRWHIQLLKESQRNLFKPWRRCSLAVTRFRPRKLREITMKDMRLSCAVCAVLIVTAPVTPARWLTSAPSSAVTIRATWPMNSSFGCGVDPTARPVES